MSLLSEALQKAQSLNQPEAAGYAERIRAHHGLQERAVGRVLSRFQSLIQDTDAELNSVMRDLIHLNDSERRQVADVLGNMLDQEVRTHKTRLRNLNRMRRRMS